MNFSLYIAKRYLFTKSSNNAINIITIIAAFGIIAGTAALFIVLSGFGGLKTFSLAYISFLDPDLKVQINKGKSFELTPEQISQLESNPNIASYTKLIEERLILNYGDKNEIVNVKAVDTNFPLASIEHIIDEQSNWMLPNTDQVVVGSKLAYKLNLGLYAFDKVPMLYTIKPGKGQITNINTLTKRLKVNNVGTFSVNEDIDNATIFANIESLQYLLDYNANQITAIDIHLKNLNTLETTKTQLQSIFGDNFTVKTRLQLNDALYKMLNTENLAVYLIFTLILVIALFNIIGAIVMMILDKRKDLATLFNMGTTLHQIKLIFFLQGTLMTIIGGSLGLILGIIIVILQQQFNLIYLLPSVPYPMEFKLLNILVVFLTISVLGILASRVATARINKNLLT